MLIPVHHFAARYGRKPKLADVEAQEMPVEGQNMWALRRTGAPPEEGLLVSAEGVAIAIFFDGTRDLREVQKALYERYGQLLYIERIHELASALHRTGLLDGSPRAALADRAAPEEPKTSPGRRDRIPYPRGETRPAAHAGTAYEREPRLLREQLEACFTHAEGPGAVAVRAGEGPGLGGIVAPHIDLRRGGPAYGHAYKALAEGSDADLFVVFGTAHQSPGELFTLTRRHYETPLGAVPTDADAAAILERELGASLFREEAAHDAEHSIELQALFLRYLNPERSISMLPILCSSLYGLVPAQGKPRDEATIDRFLAALARATAGRRVAYIAAADLSHVGRLYGDEEGPGPEALQSLERRDLESIDRIVAGDAEGFFEDVAPDADTRRICGLTPIYMLLRATGGAPARLLKYAQWHGAAEASAVTYAALSIDQR